MTRLTTIANECGTDKGTLHGNAHGYTTVYEALFEPYRDQAITLLEIGLAIGGPEMDFPAGRQVTDAPSMRMWREYFPKAHVHGLDISDFSAFQTDWFTFHQADCGDADRLEQIAGLGLQFDIIIDDGSHASFHQQLTLAKLFGSLKPGGLYIIEDMDWVPSTYERTLPGTPRTAHLLADFVAEGRFGQSAIDASVWSKVADDIDNVMLFNTDFLVAGAQSYNMRNGISRRIKNKRVSRALQNLGRPFGSDAKLAVIQKRGAPAATAPSPLRAKKAATKPAAKKSPALSS